MVHSRTFPSPPKETLSASDSLLIPLPQPLATTHLLVALDLPVLGSSWTWNHPLFVCLCLASVSQRDDFKIQAFVPLTANTPLHGWTSPLTVKPWEWAHAGSGDRPLTLCRASTPGPPISWQREHEMQEFSPPSLDLPPHLRK